MENFYFDIETTGHALRGVRFSLFAVRAEFKLRRVFYGEFLS